MSINRRRTQTCDNFSIVLMVSRCEKTMTNIQKLGSGKRDFEADDETSEVPGVTPEPKTAELILPMTDPLMPWMKRASSPQTS